MNPKPPAICPECRQRLAVHECSGAKGLSPKGGCREPKTIRVQRGLENRAKQRLDPAYQKRSARLTRKRLKLFAKPQRKIKLTKEQLQSFRPKQTMDGWKIFPGGVWSWLHDVPGGDVQAVQGWEGIRQETSHHVQLTPITKQAAIEARAAVQGLRRQIQASTLNGAALDREVTRLCRRGPLRGVESWVRWLVLTKAPAWRFYPWSVELTKLVDSHTGRAIVVQANLSLRPGLSKREAKRAAVEVATRWLELNSKKGRPGLPDDEKDAIQTAYKQIWERDGKPNRGHRNDFIEKVVAELKRMGFSLNKTTVGNRCRKFFQEKGLRIKSVIASKRDPDRLKHHSV